MKDYIRWGATFLLPIVFTVIFYLLEKKTAFGRLNYKIRQAIIGVVFGGLAVLGTEWGISLNGANLNCRDSAVMAAGLMFGAPAGVIAGVIGAVERWFAGYWGVAPFTQLACSISTLLAGIYTGLLRKYMFENRRPGWFLSLSIGVVMEIFHMALMLLTNIGDPVNAILIVESCTLPLVLGNSLSLAIASALLALFGKEVRYRKKHGVRISQTIQNWLLLVVLVAFVITTAFVYALQEKLAENQSDTLLELALDETEADVMDASDKNLLTLAKIVAEAAKTEPLEDIAKQYNISEISQANWQGIITESTEPVLIGFDFRTGEQSAEFLCLLSTKREFVQSYGPISFDTSIYRKYAGVRNATGFIQIGYDAEQFHSDISTQMVGITKNRHVGESGYILIFDENMNVVSAPNGASYLAYVEQLRSNGAPDPNTTFVVESTDESCYCRYRTTEGYYIVAVYPETEALQLRNIALYVNAFLEVLVFAILFALVYLLVKKVVVNQIKSINTSLARITEGDLNEVVNVRSNEEFASLSDDINSTVDTLKRYIAEASARIDKELEFAKNIQSSALPNVFPAFPKRNDFDIFASMNPAKEVGGDFYDFYITHNNVLHFLIADVSGKGIPAAMFMMRAKTELKSLTEADMPLNEVFTRGNGALCEGNDAGMFVTAWQGSLDLETGLVRFVNAGHNPPLIRHGTGDFEYLRSKVGFVLAGMDGVIYKIQEFKLEPGDSVYLYTDGVTEATDANGELYGEERLQKALNSRIFEGPRSMCEYVRSDVDAFVGEAPQFDDITMVALKYIGTPPPPSIHLDAATIDDIPQVTAFVEAELENMDCSMKVITQISIAIDEIFSNIVRYGYADHTGPVTVEVLRQEDPARVSLRFVDEGIPYNPLTKEDPDVTLSAEKRGIGGLGIFMVKKTMDDMRYRYENEQNILTITKNL